MVLMVWEGLVTESTPATSSITSPPHRLHPLRIQKPYKYKGLGALEGSNTHNQMVLMVLGVS